MTAVGGASGVFAVGVSAAAAGAAAAAAATPAWVPLRVPLRVPVDLSREEAAELARIELSDPAYAQARPSWIIQALQWVADQLQRLLDAVARSTPGGWLGALVIVAVLALIGLGIAWRVRPAGRVRHGEAAFDPVGLTPADHRRAAEEYARDGAWAPAVRERLRAVVAELETADILESAPGRTADDIAGVVGIALPDLGEPMRRAARTFDDLWYGEREAGPQHDRQFRELDERVQMRLRRPRLAAPAPLTTVGPDPGAGGQ